MYFDVVQLLIFTQVTFLDFPNALMSSYLPHLNWSVNTVEEMRSRYVHLHVYFSSMDVHHHDQIPRITPVELLSNFGGILGLFMGASIVTVFEIVDVLVTKLHNRYRKKVKGTEAAKVGIVTDGKH